MRYRLFLAPIVLCLPTLCAADEIAPLNVKEGLWEQTVTHSMSGMPTGANIPPEVLAKLPPEQRARMEAMMSGKPSTSVHKECITKEKLATNAAFANNRGECTRTVVSSTGRKLEVKFHCQDKDAASDGNLVVEAIGTDNVKGTMHMVANSGESHNLTMDFTFSSKYLGAACGDVK